MSIGKGVLHSKSGHAFPLAGGVIFYVAKTRFIVIGLAQVVQKGNKRKGFLAVFRFIKIPLHQHMIYIQAVHHKATLTCSVEAGRGGRREKVGGAKPIQQFICTGPCDIFTKNAQKFFFIVHHSNFHFF